VYSLYSPDCREYTFSETGLPVYGVLGNWASGVWSSRKLGFRCMEFSETQFMLLLILRSPIYRGNSMRSGLGLCTNAQTTFRCTGFSETRLAPVLLTQDREVLPPPHRTGYERYSPRFREPSLLGN
jgi:hypothetical protein